MSKSKFFDFATHILDNKTILIHASIRDEYSFYQTLFEFFFDESRLLSHIERKVGITFTPTKKNYVALYKQLRYYIDEENYQFFPDKLSSEMKRILQEEYTLEDKGNGFLKVRLDTMGKIGEFLCSTVLSEYFEFTCIIPKVNLTTDYNMSIYGIDSLYYSEKEDLIMFGESKLTNNIINGKDLINKSLKSYEEQIRTEFMLILSNRLLRNEMSVFSEKYADSVEISIRVEDFIREADIRKIGVPLFIAHGTEVTPDTIFQQLAYIKQPQLLNLETQYYIISLPIVNKSKMISVFTHAIAERMHQYESEISRESSNS